MTHVKWLRSIEAITTRFAGYQHTAYQYSQSRSEPGEPVTLMRVRSLLIPPGIPDFLTRHRIVRRGVVEVRGRAWSGRSRVTQVEVSADGGTNWWAAEVSPPPSPHAWQAWQATWVPPAAGLYDLCCRATDAAGNVQPIEQAWTARGMGNNMVQRVRVQVV